MIAAAGAGFPAADREPRHRDAAPTDGARRQRHWSREVYFVRSPDLRDETRREMGPARAVWEELHSQLWSRERRGRTEDIRNAARGGILKEVGIRGLARGTGCHHATVSRHLARLESLNLIRVHRVEARGLERDAVTGRITRSSGRETCVVIEVTVGPEHLRPFGAQRDGGRGVVSARRATPSRKEPFQGSLSKPQTPPRRPACGAGHRAAEPIPMGSEVPQDFILDEDKSDAERLVLRCPACGHAKRGPTHAVRAKAGVKSACTHCGTLVSVPRDPVIHGAVLRIRDRAGHSAGRAAGLTAGVREGEGIVGSVAGQAVTVSPTTSSIVSPEPEPEPATPGQAPAVTPDPWSRSTLTSDWGPADRPAAGTPEPATVEPGPPDNDERGLEEMIRKMRQRDAGYTVPERIDRAIVATWTGGRVA